MSGIATATAPATALGVTQRRVVISEWIKFRSLRSTWWSIGVALLVSVGLGILFSDLRGHDIQQNGGFEPDQTALSLRGFYLAQLAIGVLGVLSITGEYSTGMIRATLSAVPKRVPVWAAKIAVFAAVVFGITLVAAFAAFLGRRAWLLRDPTPYSLARRSRLVSAEVESSAREGPYVVERVRLRAAGGLSVEMAVKRPADHAGRRPLVGILGGMETGRNAVDLIDDTRGTVVAALSYPYRDVRSLHGARVVAEIPAVRRAILDTPPAILLALDHPLAQPYVDPRAAELAGVSLGAPFAVVAGALDPRCRRVWSIHGAGDLEDLLAAGLERSIALAPLRDAVAALAYALGAGPSIAPERWVGRISPRPFVMINGLADERLPRGAILALYARARAPKEIVWLAGRHVEPERRRVVQELVGVVLDRVAPRRPM